MSRTSCQSVEQTQSQIYSENFSIETRKNSLPFSLLAKTFSLSGLTTDKLSEVCEFNKFQFIRVLRSNFDQKLVNQFSVIWISLSNLFGAFDRFDKVTAIIFPKVDLLKDFLWIRLLQNAIHLFDI